MTLIWLTKKKKIEQSCDFKLPPKKKPKLPIHNCEIHGKKKNKKVSISLAPNLLLAKLIACLKCSAGCQIISCFPLITCLLLRPYRQYQYKRNRNEISQFSCYSYAPLPCRATKAPVGVCSKIYIKQKKQKQKIKTPDYALRSSIEFFPIFFSFFFLWNLDQLVARGLLA